MTAAASRVRAAVPPGAEARGDSNGEDAGAALLPAASPVPSSAGLPSRARPALRGASGLSALCALLAIAALGLPASAAASGEAGGDAAPGGLEETDQQRALRLLDRMNLALRSLDYEGILVYLLDGRLETLHLVHRVDGGEVQERLLSLSGPVRAVTRSRDRVTCTMPDGHPISVKSHGGRRLLHTDRIDPAGLAGRYRVEALGTARVAGRETEGVAIRPLDDLRYGYRLELDRETGLPLKSDLIDRDGNPIEQLLFASLTLAQPQPQPFAAPETDGPPGEPALAPAAPPHATRWRFDPRPAGFEQTLHDAIQDRNGARVDHFVFSDRLSSYSIYIESDTRNGLDGVTRMGAAHAAGRRVGDYQVTAVGEVPAATVEAAVAGARQAPEGTP